jgi:dTMP kinase
MEFGYLSLPFAFPAKMGLVTFLNLNSCILKMARKKRAKATKKSAAPKPEDVKKQTFLTQFQKFKKKQGKKGLFLVIEGIDGSGKSAQAKMIAQWLEEKGYSILLTREPSSSIHGQKVKVLARAKENLLNTKEWINLFTLDRQEHLANEIMPALEEGRIVICERYYYATLAYQLDNSNEWRDYAKGFLQPDLVIFLDLPTSTAFNRIADRYSKEGKEQTVFEKQDIMEKTRQKFLLINRHINDNIKIIDGSGTKDEIFDKIKKEVMNVLRTMEL